MAGWEQNESLEREQREIPAPVGMWAELLKLKRENYADKRDKTPSAMAGDMDEARHSVDAGTEAWPF